MLGVLKELPISPVEVAVELRQYSGETGKSDVEWMTDYRRSGYSAIDLMSWMKLNGGFANDFEGAVKNLFDAGYSLKDIALAVKNVYNPDLVTAIKGIAAVNLSNNKWTYTDISAALQAPIMQPRTWQPA